VKLAAPEDTLDMRRLAQVTPDARGRPERLARYRAARARLRES